MLQVSMGIPVSSEATCFTSLLFWLLCGRFRAVSPIPDIEFSKHKLPDGLSLPDFLLLVSLVSLPTFADVWQTAGSAWMHKQTVKRRYPSSQRTRQPTTLSCCQSRVQSWSEVSTCAQTDNKRWQINDTKGLVERTDSKSTSSTDVCMFGYRWLLQAGKAQYVEGI